MDKGAVGAEQCYSPVKWGSFLHQNIQNRKAVLFELKTVLNTGAKESKQIPKNKKLVEATYLLILTKSLGNIVNV